MSKHESTPFVIPYVTDGLILYLDGIEQGDEANVWTDLINGMRFVKKGSGVTFNRDNVQFTGTNANQCLYSSDTFSPPHTNTGTVEVCYRDAVTTETGVQVLLYSGNVSGAIGFQIWKRQIAYASYGANYYTGVWNDNGTGTYSVSSARAYQNLVNVGFTSTKAYQSRSANVVIVGASGRGASTFYDQYKGKLHSVRVYNRQLTEEEILYNQAVDNTRFNLGLTIPT